MMVSACAVLGKRLVMSGGRASRHTHDSLHACLPGASGVALHATPAHRCFGTTYVPATIYRKFREYGHRRPAGV